ncbi:uncharacterized protein [Centruroides vittatus]|uniref:uncharacterized protein n=1 Tax=Centruroides vittatus TaxID=120091 RepID=UPI003510BAEC
MILQKIYSRQGLILYCLVLFILLICPTCIIYDYIAKYDPEPSLDLVNFSDSNNETGYPRYIVPDIVHLIRFDSPELTFVDMVCIKSILLNHKPKTIIVHCNCHTLTGKYWDTIKDVPELKVQYRKKPEYIFGTKISWIEHSSDVTRIEILREYGGIYLDNDVFVVNSLHEFRRFEMTLGWDLNGNSLGNQVLIAHKNARFLKYWYESYEFYDPEKWYYNAGEFPTRTILYAFPELVHRVIDYFGVNTDFAFMLYSEKTDEWKKFYTLHLLIHHRYLVADDRPEIFDENNIITYNRTFGDMVRSVL